MNKKDLIEYIEKLIIGVENQAREENQDINGVGWYAGYIQGLRFALNEVKLLNLEENYI